MDCLAVTGSDPIPLAVVAVTMIAAAVLLLVVARRRRRRDRGRVSRAGTALTTTVVLTLAVVGGTSLLGTPTARAAACVTQPAAGTTGAAVADTSDGTETDTETGTTTGPATEDDPAAEAPGTPSTPDASTPNETDPDPAAPDETTPDETTPAEDPEVEPVADTFALTLGPSERGSGQLVATVEWYSLVLTRVSGEDDGTAITVAVPDQADGYWTATALLNADGSTATDVTVTREATGTVFTIATQPGDTRTFLVVLQYDSTSWEVYPAMPPGHFLERIRPASTLVAGLMDHRAEEGSRDTYEIVAWEVAGISPPMED